MIKLICSPGIGHLDNALPLIEGLSKKINIPANIFYTKKMMISHLINNPTLLNLHDKYFSKKHFIVKDKVISFNETNKISKFIKNRILTLVLFNILIPLKISILINLISKFYNLKISDIKNIFKLDDIIIYDPYENDKIYFSKIKKLIEKNFKIGLRHGVGNDYFGKHETSFKIKNLFYLIN